MHERFEGFAQGIGERAVQRRTAHAGHRNGPPTMVLGQIERPRSSRDPNCPPFRDRNSRTSLRRVLGKHVEQDPDTTGQQTRDRFCREQAIVKAGCGQDLEEPRQDLRGEHCLKAEGDVDLLRDPTRARLEPALS